MGWEKRADEPYRIRGRKLQRIRAEYFQRHPLCVMCEAKGRVTAATELDHVIPLAKGGKDEASNRQGLCHECHEAKSIRDKGYEPRPTIGLDGWPR